MAKNDLEDELDDRLLRIYKRDGLKKFLDVCSELLNIKDRENGNKKKHFNGEVCEVVLDVLTQYYLEKRGLKGSTFHSLILGKPGKELETKFKTELDMVLLTPYLCATGECKSFCGDVVVTGDCTLSRGDLIADVSRQSTLHKNVMSEYLQLFLKNKEKAQVHLFCFVYSNGTLDDRRASVVKQKIPVLTVGTLFKYYDRLCSQCRAVCFDYEGAKKLFTTMSHSEVLRKQHREYLGY